MSMRVCVCSSMRLLSKYKEKFMNIQGRAEVIRILGAITFSAHENFLAPHLFFFHFYSGAKK